MLRFHRPVRTATAPCPSRRVHALAEPQIELGGTVSPHRIDGVAALRYRSRMDWIASPLATLLGGGIVGAGSALLLESVRSRRDERKQWQDSRREVYVAYLTELSRTYESLWALALGDSDPPNKNMMMAARQSLRDGELYQTRQRLKITAPIAVITACDLAYAELRSLRSVVGRGIGADSSEFISANQSYRNAVHCLHVEIRRDLGVTALPGEPPGGE